MRPARSLTLGALAAALLAMAGVRAFAPPQTGELTRTEDMYVRHGKAIDPETAPGKPLFAAHCAGCHEGGMPKAPAPSVLSMMAPDAVLGAMNGGIMAPMAAGLDQQQRRQIAEYLTRTSLADYRPPAPPKRCEGAARNFDLRRPPAVVGWGHDNRRFVPAAIAGLTAADVPRLKLAWAFAYPAAVRARSQPMVALGAIFVGSQDGTVFALDLATGCTRWSSRVSGEVRTGIVMQSWAAGDTPPRPPLLFFGDIAGRAIAMDARTGRVVWQTKVDDHPASTITGTPALADGTLFVPVSSFEVASVFDPKYRCCTFRGAVIALDAATGAVRWKHYTIPAPASPRGTSSAGTQLLGPSGAPVWGSPTVDLKRRRLYFGSGENYSSPADGNSDAVFAVDMDSGQRIWQQQGTTGDAWNGACMMHDHPNCPKEDGPDLDFSASPLLVDLGGGRLAVIAGEKSGEVFAFDPDDGHLLWKRRVGRGGIQGGVHFGMAAEGRRIYVPMVDLAHGRSAEKHTDAGKPGLHALDARTGQPLWSAPMGPELCRGRDRDCDPGISAAVTAMPGIVFAGGLDGRLRAYAGATGRVLWEADTTTPVRSVNGVIAHGGSMSGPGPAIADGRVIVNSGYGLYFHTPGNALLVYTAGPERTR